MARYFLNIGANWGDTANWSDTSGGTGGFSVPTSSDAVFFDANSGNCTVNATARTAASLNFTGYTNTITMTNHITISGNVTFASGMSITDSSSFIIDADSTITSNGKSIPYLFFSGINLTYTLADNCVVINQLYVNSTNSGVFTLNGNQLTLSGNLYLVGISANYILSGTTALLLNGNTGFSGNGSLGLSTTINTAGTISGYLNYSIGTFTHIAGTFTSNLYLGYFGDVTLNLNGLSITDLFLYDSISVSSNFTITGQLQIIGIITISGVGIITTSSALLSLNVGGHVSLTLPYNMTFANVEVGWGTSAYLQQLNGFTLFCTGNFTVRGGGTLSGTTTIVLSGTGTWSHTYITQVQNNLTINTAGTVTISGSVYYSTGTLTYIAGTVTTTGSTLDIGAGTCTLNTNGINWNNFYSSNGNYTITVSSDLHIYGNAVLAGTTGGNTTTLNGSNIYCYSNLSNSNGIITGTCKIILAGTGTVVTSAGGFSVSAIDINTAGTITFNDNLISNLTFTYIAGTVNPVGTLIVSNGCALDLDGTTFGGIDVSGAANAITLTSDLHCTSFNTNGFNNTSLNGFSCYTNSIAITGNALFGTTNLIFSGTGSWSGTGYLFLNTNINTPGILTLSGSIGYSTGTLTYTTGTVVTTSSALFITGGAILDTDGMTWNDIYTYSGNTVTLLSDLHANYLTNNVPTTYNGAFTIYLKILSAGSTMIGSGGIQFVMNQSGGSMSGGAVGIPITINLVGTFTIYTFNIGNGGYINKVSGTVTVHPDSSFHFGNATGTYNLSGIVFENVTMDNGIYTFNTDLNISGNFHVYGTGPTANGNPIYVGGNFTHNIYFSGASNIILNGTGTWSGTVWTIKNVEINTVGTITLGNIQYRVGTITYTTGTVVAAPGSTLQIFDYATLNTNGMSWNTVSLLGGGYGVTLASTLQCNNIILTGAGFQYFYGAAGFETNNFTCTIPGRTFVFTTGNTYTIGKLTLTGSVGSKIILQSTAASHAYVKVKYRHNVTNTNATWIDSSNGVMIHSVGATLSNTVNWNNVTEQNKVVRI